jgi:DNA excision repair protein ERCC-4
MARSLLDAYGSIAAIAAAAPEGLRRHPGIGRVRANRLAEALHSEYIAPADREPEPERSVRGSRPARRWILSPSEDSVDPESFDRRAIALRALRAAPAGTQLIDSLTGEVVSGAPPEPTTETDSAD